MEIKVQKLLILYYQVQPTQNRDGYYTNLEGKLQKAYKASYPPGECKRRLANNK